MRPFHDERERRDAVRAEEANLGAVAIKDCLYAGISLDGVKTADLFAASEKLSAQERVK